MILRVKAHLQWTLCMKKNVGPPEEMLWQKIRTGNQKCCDNFQSMFFETLDGSCLQLGGRTMMKFAT